MAIRYSETKEFTKTQLGELYGSVGHPAADNPARLKAAAAGSSRVISAWDGKRLVGLIRAIDDGAMTAYVCEMVVCVDGGGQVVKDELKKRMTAAYAQGFHLAGIPETD